MTDDRLSQIYEERMGPNVGAAALAYLGSQYEELKVPNSAARNKLADFLDKQPAQLKEKICVLPIKMASVVEQMRNPQNICMQDVETMQKHHCMYDDIHQVIDRTMPAFAAWTQKFMDAGEAVHGLDKTADLALHLEYGLTRKPEVVQMHQAVQNECLPPKDCDVKQAEHEVKQLAHNIRAYRTQEQFDAGQTASFSDAVQFMETNALQASQAMKALGETLQNYVNLPVTERQQYAALANIYPQEVKVAAYVASARGEEINSPEVLQEHLHRPDVVLAAHLLDENAVTPTAESVQKAMFAQKAVRIMRDDMGADIELLSSEGRAYMQTAQKMGEAALIACCVAANKGEKIVDAKELMLKSAKTMKLMSYMHDEKFPQRQLNMQNLDNAVAHVRGQQKTFEARQMLQNYGYHLG